MSNVTWSRLGGRIMIVDDDPAVRSAHERLLKAMGYDVEVAADGVEALAKLELGVDIILLDGEMPQLDGFSVAERIRLTPKHATIPIVMVTGLGGPGLERRALEAGINDLLPKPLRAEELQLRLRWLLEFKRAQDDLADRNRELERSLEDRTRVLRETIEHRTHAERHVYDAHLDTIRRLAVAAEFKDRNTADHVERVGLYAGILAAHIGLSPTAVETIRHAAPMHDVGKIGIPDAILLKPSGLDEVEWAIMRKHTTFGAKLLGGSESPVLRMAERIALSHHEKWNGTGYPEGLSGTDIPLEARICALVDYFDAVTMPRPYRGPFPTGHALEYIRQDSGAHFDPELRDAFLAAVPSILEARNGDGGGRNAAGRLGLPASLDELQ